MQDERISRAFGPDDLKPLLDEAGIDATVLVQTVPDLEETREFLALAAEHPFIAGVIGWVDLTDGHLSQALHSLREGPGGERLVGIRHQVEDEEDDAWLAREDVQTGLNIIADAGLIYDLLIRPRHLHLALMTAQDNAHLRFVIDHMAKPDIANHGFEAWNAAIHEFAGLENVACKLSGILTEAGAGWDVETLRPYVRSAVEIFGPHRLMIGSDWPVSLLAADYATTLATLRETLAELNLADDDMDAILGRTAIHWYGLHVPEASGE
jgi:L-fuconolactonase